MHYPLWFPHAQAHALRAAEQALQAVVRTPVSLPRELRAGVPDPRFEHARFFPSLYDAPQRMAAIQTNDAWLVAWEYMEKDEPGGLQPLAPGIWGRIGVHSHRLLSLEGVGRATSEGVSEALEAWLTQGVRTPCSHRDVMGYLVALTVDQVRQAGDTRDARLASKPSVALQRQHHSRTA